jgi:hypothetical protein
LLSRERVGETYRTRGDLRPDNPVGVRVIETTPSPVPTPGIPAVDQFVGYLNDRWPNWSNGGLCVCKHIAGSSSWSDHAYCAALDVFDTDQHMHEIAEFAADNAAKLRVAYVIYEKRIWTAAEGWHYYSGEYHYHDHISFEHGPARLACQ